MAVIFYPAIVERAGSTYSVFFPDLPGLGSAGETVQQAAHNAEEALEGHLIAMAQQGEAIPDPSELDTIEHDPDVDEAARILVRAEKPGKQVRVNISIDEALLSRIDRVAGNRARSGFLADAARAALAGRGA